MNKFPEIPKTQCIIVLAGCPACGKTTLAKEIYANRKDCVIVSRDSIREARGSYNIPEQEDYISDIREVAKAETDKYDVYRYDDVVYEKGLQVLSKPSSLAIVPKAKKNERFAIYIKGAEIRASEDREYRQQLDHGFLVQTDRILRFELQLRSFDAMRKFCGIRIEYTPCLMDILKSDKHPVYNKFCELIDNEKEVNDED